MTDEQFEIECLKKEVTHLRELLTANQACVERLLVTCQQYNRLVGEYRDDLEKARNQQLQQLVPADHPTLWDS